MLNKEKIVKFENIISKVRYVLMFIIFMIFAVGLNRLINVKNTQGYYHREYLILTIIYGILSMFFIIYNCKKSKKSIEKIFLTFMIPIGILYLVFLLPTYAPDEPPHMWKAYEVSTGKLVTEIDENGKSKTKIPRELGEYGISRFQNYSDINLSQNTDYNDEAETNTPAQGYPFFLYIGSAVGFLISRVLNINILIGVYLGKIINFIIFLVGSYFSIKKIPFGKLTLLAFLFIPMILQQVVSFSADVVTNTITLYFIAFMVNLIFKEEKITKKEKILLYVFSALVAMSKVVYLPLVGMTLLLYSKKDMSKKEKTMLIIPCILISTIVALGTYMFSCMYTSESLIPYFEENNVNGSEQIKYIICHPRQYLDVIFNDLYYNGETYIYTMIGTRLGWINIQIDTPIITSFIFVLLASVFLEKNKMSFSKRQKIWNMVLIIASIILVQTAMYISWTAVKKCSIDGIQGRYFIPIIFLFLITLAIKNNYIKIKNIEYILPIVVSILNIFVINNIYKFFV